MLLVKILVLHHFLTMEVTGTKWHMKRFKSVDMTHEMSSKVALFINTCNLISHWFLLALTFQLPGMNACNCVSVSKMFLKVINRQANLRKDHLPRWQTILKYMVTVYHRLHLNFMNMFFMFIIYGPYSFSVHLTRAMRNKSLEKFLSCVSSTHKTSFWEYHCFCML